MISYKVTFTNGHFYDQASKKRILPVDGKEFILLGEEDAFQQEDVLIKKPPTKVPEEKQQQLIKKYDNNLIKILDSNSYLDFRIGLGASKKWNENKQYVFKCKILEDLFIYLPKHSDPKSPENWRLVDCNCQLIECVIGGVIINDEIHARSLNQLFTHTVMFFFSLQRSGSCNPFTTYFLLPEQESEETITLNRIYAKGYKFLNNTRIEKVSNIFPKNASAKTRIK